MIRCLRAIAVGAALGVVAAVILFRLAENFDANLIGF